MRPILALLLLITLLLAPPAHSRAAYGRNNNRGGGRRGNNKPPQPVSLQEDDSPKRDGDWCEFSSAFSAPMSKGSLGLKVKRDANAQESRGLFHVVSVEPSSPGFGVLHVGDTIVSVNGQSTAMWKIAQFSEAMQAARNENEGVVKIVFWSKENCVKRQVRGGGDSAEKEDGGEGAVEEDQAEVVAKAELEAKKAAEIKAKEAEIKALQKAETKAKQEEAAKQAKSAADAKAEQAKSAAAANARDDYDEDEEYDEEEDLSNMVLGNFDVIIDGFAPPLGLRVAEEGEMLKIMNILSPKRWSKVAVGDYIVGMGPTRDPIKTMADLKNVVAMHSDGMPLHVLVARPISKKPMPVGASAKEVARRLVEFEEGPVVTYKLTLLKDHPRELLALVDLPSNTWEREYGYVAIVSVLPQVDYVAVGDRVKRVGKLGVTYAGEIPTLMAQESLGGATVSVTFVRGASGTSGALAKMGVISLDFNKQRDELTAEKKNVAAVETSKSEKEFKDEAELEKMKFEAMQRVKEVMELKVKAEAAMKDLERAKEERELERMERKRKAFAEVERQTAESEKQNVLSHAKQARQREECSVEYNSKLEDAIQTALSNPEIVRALAKHIAELVKEHMT